MKPRTADAIERRDKPGYALLAERAFDAAYLATVISAGVLLFISGSAERRIWGIGAFILAAGDAFHLIPRMLNGSVRAKGLGKAVVSVTMTLFYAWLWYLLKRGGFFDAAAAVLAAARIALCASKRNEWTSPNPPRIRGIIRNIPLAALGGLTAWGYAANGMPDICSMILIGFAFYVPVVLWAYKTPKLGMLMIPKSVMYAAIVLSGFKF